MATCSFLYHEGAKVILRDPVILIGSEEKVLALLRFIQAEGFLRCSYVRSLFIDMDTMPESVAQILADLVPRMSELCCLCLNRDPERMFESYPYLLPTFAGLRCLKTLWITVLGERCLEMTRTLQSELVVANIRLPPIELLDLSAHAASHPILTLKQSAASLTHLFCQCLFDASGELTFSPPEVVYPKLRTLRLYDQFPLNPIPFIKSFPNLVSFHMESAPPRERMDTGSFRVQREVNLGLQHSSQDGQVFRWKHLQEFTGHLGYLWTLGLACSIPRLFLEDTPALRPSSALTDVLAYAQSTHLTIAFENHSLTDVLGGGFLDALRSDGASGLRYLTFLIDLMADDRNLDVGHILVDLESALSGLKLCDLNFTVRDIGLSPSEPAGNDQSRMAPPSGLAERTLNDFDVHALTRRLLVSIPTLQNMLIGIERPGECGGGVRFACMNQMNDRHPLHEYVAGHKIDVYTEMPAPHSQWREMFASTVRTWNHYQYICNTMGIPRSDDWMYQVL